MRATARTLVSLFALVLVLGAFAVGAAGAQDDCYPDGCAPVTNPPATDDPACGVVASSVQAGTTVEVTVSNVAVGDTVRVQLGGETVAEGTAALPGGFLPFQADRVTLSLSFVADVAPGTYDLVAVGPDFTVLCGGGQLSVLADGASSGGGLAFTGLSVFALVALALVLLALGYTLRRHARA